MGKFEKEAKQLLEAIGGKENVNAQHACALFLQMRKKQT